MRAFGVLFACFAVACAAPDHSGPQVVHSQPKGPECGHGALDADPHNCGECGHDCAQLAGIDSSSVSCNEGVCVFGCLAGRAHCSADADDGCEADLSAPSTCGACGNSCSGKNSCAPDGSGSFQCQSGCGSANECGGQCVDLSTDADNCGACGQACPQPANGSGSCAAAQCALTCNAGFVLMNGACASMQPNTWTPQTAGTTRALYGVWGSPAGDLFITGDKGTVLQAARGSSFAPLSSSSSNQLAGVWGTDATNVLSVGWSGADQGGAIFRPQLDGSWAGGGLVKDALSGVWGSAVDNVYAVGDEGTILHNQGGRSWSPEDAGSSQTLWSVWGSSASDVYAVGGNGVIVHSADGSTWSRQKSGGRTELLGVWSASATDVWAVGRGGLVLHSGGDGNWAPETSGASDDLFAVAGVGGDLWAVGDNGVIIHRAAGVWAPETSGTTRALFAVWGSATDGVFAVGDAGTILHR